MGPSWLGRKRTLIFHISVPSDCSPPWRGAVTQIPEDLARKLPRQPVPAALPGRLAVHCQDNAHFPRTGQPTVNTGQKVESTTCEFPLGELGRLVSAKVWLGAIFDHRRQLKPPSLGTGAAIRRFDRLFSETRPANPACEPHPLGGGLRHQRNRPVHCQRHARRRRIDSVRSIGGGPGSVPVVPRDRQQDESRPRC